MRVSKAETWGAGGILIALVILLLGGYFSWRVERWYHYKFGYESQVANTVRDLVKPECLRQ